MATKTDLLLSALSNNLGRWTCAYCGSKSGQPAATFRELKKRGYKFEEVSPGRWANNMFCSKCNDYRTHYKLLSIEPVFEEKPRISFSPATRKRIIELLENRDAFTGASITSTAEIDHKIPWTRLEQDINANQLSDSQIKEHFQLLTREHNLLKDRMCGKCKLTRVRPPFFEISYWYKGNKKYKGSCEGCGWYDGSKWRKELDNLLNE